MDIHDRIIYIRKYFELSQSAFADKIHLQRNSVTLLETRRRNPSERTKKDICKEFGVSYLWLDKGIEPIFESENDTTLAKIDYIMTGENELAKSIFKSFAKLDEKEWELLGKILADISGSLYRED